MKWLYLNLTSCTVGLPQVAVTAIYPSLPIGIVKYNEAFPTTHHRKLMSLTDEGFPTYIPSTTPGCNIFYEGHLRFSWVMLPFWIPWRQIMLAHIGEIIMGLRMCTVSQCMCRMLVFKKGKVILGSLKIIWFDVLNSKNNMSSDLVQ